MSVEILGYASALLFGLAFAFYHPRLSLITSVSASGCLATYCLLSGSPATAFYSLFSVGLTLLALRVSEKHLKKLVGGYVAALWVITLFTLANPLELLATLGNSCSGLARLGRDDFWCFRWYMMLGNGLWIFYGWFIDSAPIMLSTGVIVSVSAITMLKYANWPAVAAFFKHKVKFAAA
ncbi:MAG: YgjV family protein [Alphaproteobacteria bacterium]|nr:YgjV family protein [Alphaproteobacteria bacterium]MDD9919854.1 YgjV family protein [Alphaproteobacteria bacterium]